MRAATNDPYFMLAMLSEAAMKARTARARSDAENEQRYVRTMCAEHIALTRCVPAHDSLTDVAEGVVRWGFGKSWGDA